MGKHMLMLLDRVEIFLKSPTFRRLCTEGYFDTKGDAGMDFRRRDVWKFLDGIAASDDELRNEGAARRLVANICDIFGDVPTPDAAALLTRVGLLRSYFQSCYAGQKDEKKV